ncbi:acyltransferase family protein [Paenibacillus sp. y28]|uniref:acyltransferase family protein n=1 Tax=Paenibacillus sp. y28 TaxID=3129110 RepID=UPI0030179993
MSTPTTGARYYELDSIRGIAAIIVLLFHCYQLLGLPEGIKNVIAATPLRLLISGHQSVILFFLLSGFVLSLPFNREKKPGYSVYVLKRVCRIYIPYLVAVAVGFAARTLFNAGAVPGLWNNPVDGKVILQHVLLVGEFNQNYFDPVIWSLVHEMRISLVFPVLVYVMNRFGWKVSLPATLLLSFTGMVLLRYHSSVDYFTNHFDTLHYAGIFILGALTAKYKPVLLQLLERSRMKHVLLVLAFGMYLYGAEYAAAYGIFGSRIGDLAVACCGILFMLFIFSSPTLTSVLRCRPLQFAGQLSYSLYLYHLIIILALVNRMGHWNGAALLLLTLLLSVLAAVLGYHLVEKPSIRLGAYLTAPRHAAPAAVQPDGGRPSS